MKFFLKLVIATISQSLILLPAYGESLFEGAKEDFISPFTTKADSSFYLGLFNTGLVYIYFKNDLISDTQDQVSREKPLRGYAAYGDYGGQMIPNILYVSGMYFAYYFSENNKYKTFANHMLRASVHSGLMVQILKKTVREKRPNSETSRESFPSGHTSTAFAFASVIGMNHDFIWGALGYSLATFVGLSRINNNAHYLHDVLAGAVIGTSYGLGIYYRNENKTSGKTISLYPSYEENTMTINFLKEY